MKTKLILTIMAMALHATVFSQHTLTVEISGLSNSNGQVLFQLLDQNEKELKGIRSDIKGNKCLIVVEGLKPAKYAFRYFHDENSNSKMDKTMVGIPKEGFGFSNNAKASFGPPSLDEQIFDLKANMRMECKPTYF